MANTSTDSKHKLLRYSIGIVAMNKDLNSDVIEVTPIEHFPMIDGELTDNATNYTASGQDDLGNAYSDSVPTAATVKATWKRFGDSNRTTSPDVRRGEQVQLWRYADADAFYWSSLSDGSLRRLETVTHAYSATQDESTTKLDASNSYYHEVSTHNKMWHIHTSKANGEPFAYDIQIDAGNGNISLRDDIGNGIALDSKNEVITLINSQGCSFELNKQNSTWNVPDTLTINTKTMKVNSTDYTNAASNSYTVTSTTGSMKFTNLSITANTTHNGNLALNGNLTTAPGSDGSSTGTIEMRGNAIIHGNVTLDGILTAAQGGKFGATLQAQNIVSVGDISAPNL